MNLAFRRCSITSAFSLVLGSHEIAPELMQTVVAAAGLAHGHTSRHAPSWVAELANSRHSFATMAQTEDADLLLRLEKQQQPAQNQHKHQKDNQLAQDQSLQQGVTVGITTSGQRGSTGFKKTFYKRKLPSPPAIEFSSPEGRQLFQESLLEGSMVGFFKLMEQFNTQDEPAFCGLASLTMVLNALSIDPRRTWKGSWRWFHEAMLDCCRPLDVVKREGITLYQASCLARCNGARVELRPYGSTTLEQFRSEVQSICRSGEEHIVVSYSRKAFLQTGDGHFSPIGGYHRERDLVLVLDVARFKYPPHWVPLSMLYDAMSYTDPETGRPRGYMRVASNPLLDSVLFTLDLRNDGWRPADCFVRVGAPALVEALATQSDFSGEDVVRRVIDATPLASLDAFLIVRSGAPLAASTAVGTGDAAASVAGTTNPAVVASAAVPDGGPETHILAGDSITPVTIVASPSSSTSPPSRGLVAAGEGSAAVRAAAAVQQVIEQASKPVGVRKPCSGGGGIGIGAATATAMKSSCGGSCGSSLYEGPSPGGGSSSNGGNGSGGGSGGGCSKSSLMAAAAAVFTAQDRCIPLAQRQQLLDELRGMPLYTLVSNHLSATSTATASSHRSTSHQHQLSPPQFSRPSPPSSQAQSAPASQQQQLQHQQQPSGYLAEKVTMALLMQRPDSWPVPERWGNPEAGRQWWALLGLSGYSVVEAEASYLREQLQHIDEVLQSGDIRATCGEHVSRLDCAAHGHLGS